MDTGKAVDIKQRQKNLCDRIVDLTERIHALQVQLGSRASNFQTYQPVLIGILSLAVLIYYLCHSIVE